MDTDILIVDDSNVLRCSLRNWLKSVFPYCSIEESESGEEAFDRVLKEFYGIVLMDIRLPGINGIEATRKIKAFAPETRVVMLTHHEDAQYRADAFSAGASAYVSKRKMHTDLVPVLTTLLAGLPG